MRLVIFKEVNFRIEYDMSFLSIFSNLDTNKQTNNSYFNNGTNMSE